MRPVYSWVSAVSLQATCASLGGILIYGCIPPPPPPLEQSSVPSIHMNADAGESQREEIINGGNVDMNQAINSCESSGPLDRAWTGVLYEIKFGREEPTGVSQGHDIDGLNSDNGDPEGCYRSDLLSPEGVEGVDNQFAKIIPLIEAVGGEAIEGLAQGVINQGRLLLMLQLTALDDQSLNEDDCVHLESFYGIGTPHIGTQGFIVSGQTFDRDPERPSTSSRDVQLSESQLEVGGLELELPLEVFDQSYVFELDRVSINGHFTTDGEFHGFISGALDVEAVARRVEMIDGGGMIAELMPRFLRQQADLSPDSEGVCRSLSMTLTFKAKRAYLFDGPEIE